jgi:diaminopimelate epimerase
MKKVNFYKYQGAGNDFIIIDNQSKEIVLSQKEIAFLCDRRFGIGADGLMLLELNEGYDFKMVYFNSDGRESTMCGNGGRCIVKFAQDLKVIGDRCNFIAIDGAHDALILENGKVDLGMNNVSNIEKKEGFYFCDTGSPHAVLKSTNLSEMDLLNAAHKIRYNEEFREEGTNVNFISIDEEVISIRTYERGVENETLACGTGVTAAAIIANFRGWIKAKNIDVHAKGGELSVNFEVENGIYQNVRLIGPAQFVYKGNICLNI